MEWGLQSLQAVWFTTGPITTQAGETLAGDLYRAMVGGQADTTQNLPAASLALAMGNVGPNSYRVHVAPARVDYFLAPIPRPQGGQPLTDFNGMVDEFVTQLHRGIPLIGQVIRLSIIASISHETHDTPESIALISGQVGFKIPFSDGSDLVFQINRRAELHSNPGTLINRLMKWSAEETQTVDLMTASSPLISRVFLATLVVDVNIVPTGRPYPPAEQVPIFDEIAVEAKRLVAAKSLEVLQ